MELSRRQSLVTLTAAAAATQSRARGAPLSTIRLIVLDVGGTIVEDRGGRHSQTPRRRLSPGHCHRIRPWDHRADLIHTHIPSAWPPCRGCCDP